ncbi:prenyltransferase/squalene oxidase repeat-containing protein [Aneurinibacillus aneurinilyticus]|uniref:Uncharacterized protein n=3 Tax=Bacilli TaxID=91061 RepID=A0A848CJB3_ANEAE|nr:prenyltransferase/squalene oxidase repeat-containing protein [Aneurinibacillus aneurinilyticus]NME97364.1 hypothetical protein [Aneurinibacillus aneurinilyticus]
MRIWRKIHAIFIATILAFTSFGIATQHVASAARQAICIDWRDLSMDELAAFTTGDTLALTTQDTIGLSNVAYLQNTARPLQQQSGQPLEQQVRDSIERATRQVAEETEMNHSMGDWQALALARAGKQVPAWYLEGKKGVVKQYPDERPERKKITDYERMTLGVIAAGGDPQTFGGYSMLEKIYNSEDYTPKKGKPQDYMTRQGTNGVIFALIALDSGNFEVPADARWTREKLVQWLLEQQTKTGGWRLGIGEQDKTGDVDMTAMALIALAPYKEQPEVRAAAERAVEWLSGVQLNNGGFGSMWEAETVESAAQVAIALSAHGMDAAGPQFSKSGGNVITNILSYQQADGSFLHVKDGSGVNSMATEQSLQALVAYDYYLKGKGALYWFHNIEVDGLTDGAAAEAENLSFTATAHDGKGVSITPIVKMNGRIVQAEDERYEVFLKEGENVITVEATDSRGKKTGMTYTVYFNKAKPLPQQVSEAIEQAAKHVLREAEKNKYLSDWQAVGLAQSGKDIPAWYIEKLEAEIADSGGTYTKITDYERMSLGILAAGGDPTNIGGYNLIQKIYNSEDVRGQDKMTRQGTNGVIFALIALDSGNFEVPADARWTREKLVQWLLEQQTKTGGWRLGTQEQSKPGDVDMTAMALIALAPYKEQPEVQAAAERAVKWLSGVQLNNGGFGSMWEAETVESAAQVVIALSAHGMDAAGPQFSKSGGNVIANILSYQQNDGSFAHTKGGTGNGMATEQSLQALIAYDYYLNDKGPLYRFHSHQTNPDMKKPRITIVGLTDQEVVQEETLSFTVAAQDSQGGTLLPRVTLNEKEVVTHEPGRYQVTLIHGVNTIGIEAVDAAGNAKRVVYTIIYEMPPIPGDKSVEVSPIIDGPLKRGEEQPVKVKITNRQAKPQQVTLLIGIYNAKTKKLEDYKFVTQTVPEKEEETLNQSIFVPMTGDFEVKAFVWDNLEDMNILLNEPQRFVLE